MYQVEISRNNTFLNNAELAGAPPFFHWLFITFIVLMLMSQQAHAQSLNNGGSNVGSIAAEGEEDNFTFAGVSGERIHIRVADLSGSALHAGLYLYSPTGALINSTSGSDVASLESISLPVTGTYSVIVADRSSFRNQTGTLRKARQPTNYSQLAA